MTKLSRNFTGGKMNKTFDERIVPNGDYIDAMNIRMGSTENSEIGVIENTKGNLALTSLEFAGNTLSTNAVCIGALADTSKENIYWFVHDPTFLIPENQTGVLDLIVSFNVFTNILTYHVISMNDGGDSNSTLNFNPQYLITGINIIEDLLFFTDDYNAPRFINVKRNYANPIIVSGVYIDQFSAESILVIKKPPIESPSIALLRTAGQENYIDTRFICFAYRYKYADGEYSATSQWSEPAFVPNNFDFSVESFLNEGMVNYYNYVNITYNSGGPLVVGVDLLFKQSNNNIIKIIEKLDKAELGLANNTEYTYGFNNSKIYTILSESELLRLYDNVPRFAKAQTIMGNRLMYGNYIEGYDLVDSRGNPLSLDYFTNLVSVFIGDTPIGTSTDNVTYNINVLPVTSEGQLNIDLTPVVDDLVEGAFLSIDVTLTHDSFSGSITPSAQTGDFTVNLSFYLPQDYTTPYQMATSTQFQSAVGVYSNIQPVATSCGGITFTDAINCQIPMSLGALNKVRYGINNTFSPLNAPIGIVTSTSSDIIGLQFVASYFQNPSNSLEYAFEYYKILSATASFKKIGSPKSLHSNRDYEIGIVYMDEFNRSSTALVSKDNTEHIPCSYAERKNSIIATIPTTQIPPYWATRYKFVIKPSQENYETIYSSIFFIDPLTQSAYFLLEGENARKVEQGDRYIVKADSNGATQNCVYATVLEKVSKESGFIEPTTGAVPPAGTYMKIAAGAFSMVQQADAYINPGKQETSENNAGDYPLAMYPMNTYKGAGFDPLNPSWEYEDYTVPASSVIKLYFRFQRTGVGDGNGACEKRIYQLEKTLISSADYDNMWLWWIGDNVASILNDGEQEVGGGQCAITNSFDPTLAPTNTSISQNLCINYFRFYRDGTTNQLILLVRGTERCPGGPFAPERRRSTIFVQIEVYRANNLFVFETEPQDALPDVFFENNLSFPIVNGAHYGNIQNQDFATSFPAIVDTGFANCFSFGNGVESYKIRDSIIGRSFNLGERVTSVSAQDYKAANRFADITYSGIYNPESNLNKLNEFNLGLLNYKYLEVSFGEIQRMDGRETDVLVLQEDKISYVLAGKNLLSDSAAGGAIASVPEVLGTQIARTEKYGISFNPESYVQWGYDRYFTDVKRGAVLQLVGNSYSNEQLKVVSEMNMRTWFRDRFNESFNTQKLGGFDPYMNEYVLVVNDKELPINVQCLDCGVSQTFTLSGSSTIKGPYTYCVNLGSIVGDVTISWNVLSISEGATFSILAEYNGGIYSPASTFDTFLTFNKNVVTATTCNIFIIYDGDITLSITADCPIPEPIKLVEIVLTSNSDAGDLLYTEYRYTSGSYISPLQSNLVTFASGTSNPLVSRYNITSGSAGFGSFPPAGSTMTLRTNKYGVADKDFNPLTNKFRYYRSSTLYNNNSIDLNTLLGLSVEATPITGGPIVYQADFTVPPSIEGENLYLIWDMRAAVQTQLCYTSGIGIDDPVRDVCCNCLDSCCVSVNIENVGISAGKVYLPNGYCSNNFGNIVYLNPGNSIDICAKIFPGEDLNYTILEGDLNVNVDIVKEDCSCETKCPYGCERWVYYNNSGFTNTISYIDCTTGEQLNLTVPGNQFAVFCTLIYSIPPSVLSGEFGGFFQQVSGCTDVCCEGEPCTEFIITAFSPISVQYNQCGVGNTTVSYGIGTYNICVTYPFLPQITGDSYSYELSLNCGCGGDVVVPIG